MVRRGPDRVQQHVHAGAAWAADSLAAYGWHGTVSLKNCHLVLE